MKTNISLAGLTKEFGRDTVSAHPWCDPQQWENKPESGWANEPDDWDSTWTLEPDEGEMIIVTECFATFSCGSNFETSDVAASDQSLVVEAHIAGIPTAIPIITFPSMAKMMDRSRKIDVISPQDVSATSSIQKAFYVLHIPFAEDILLWSSAGLTGQAPPNHLNTYTTIKGEIPKFSKMTIRIANDRPYGDGDGGSIELAWSRYFIHIFEDPGA